MSQERIKRLLESILPGLIVVRLKRFKEMIGNFRNRSASSQRQNYSALYRKLGINRVLSGPFAGMPYIETACHSMVIPKLLGTYEKELHPAIAKICKYKPDLVINVGAAEGYYAVGLSRLIPSSIILAYERASDARYHCRRLIKRNEVGDHVRVRRSCTAKKLEKQLQRSKRPVVISDCEGYEIDLLDPKHAPSLVRTMIMVEVHDCLVSGISRAIRSRFESTHRLSIYETTSRSMKDLPKGLGLNLDEAMTAMNEERPWMQWFLLDPHTNTI